MLPQVCPVSTVPVPAIVWFILPQRSLLSTKLAARIVAVFLKNAVVNSHR